MASNDIKQPVRARKLETGKTYYPDELVEKDGELYVYSSDGSTSNRVNKSVKLLNSAKSEIGIIDPITGTDITIPDATTSAPGFVKISTTAPKAGAANASVGTETSVARGDHVHPLQTTISGNAGSADKLKTARSIGISGGITATAATFDGSKDVSINVTGIPASIVSGLGTVATSNSYTDLDNKPTIYGLAGTADTPAANGTAAVGIATRSARADHVHPLQTTVETANKLSTTTAGNTTTPVYFVDGKPTALEYTISKSVPADAKFSDTVYTHPTHTAKTSGMYKITVDSLGHVSAATAIVKADITGLGIASDSVMGTASATVAGTKGLVPASKAGDQLKFLRADGTWVVPTDTIYTHPTHTAKASGMYKITVDNLGHVSAATAITKSDITGLGIASDSIMTAATASSAGAKGLVPAPAAGANTKFLRGDGTWQTIDSGTIVSGSTTATDGASVITNPLSVAISDTAQIYQNGILLTKNTHYTINAAGNIALNGYTAEDGDIFTVVSKSTGTDVALTATGANVTLVNTAGYFDSVNNVESAIAKIGAKLNGGVVSGVKVNGTIATPDSNGVVDVASPTIQVNGTTITPSTTGVVNITDVVKTTGATMTGDLIAKATSTGNHVRNISVYASDATLPTNGNDGDIVLVYSNS